MKERHHTKARKKEYKGAGNTPTLLLKVSTSTATVEIRIGIPQECENQSTLKYTYNTL